ncbi:MAG: ribbon-helix-helix domain-containing protein [Dermatophilus congolensis]|nr:ribbon-helix-helix domain-containing protein [Dermatophilus congolensis]
MKLSVSLPDEDVALLDEIVAESGVAGRSAALRQAIAALRETRLSQEYEQAADERDLSGDATAWATTDTDGLSDEAW